MKKERLFLPKIKLTSLILLIIALSGCVENNSQEKIIEAEIVLDEPDVQKEIQAEGAQLSFKENVENTLNKLEQASNYEVLHTIKSIHLFSYLSGYYSGSHSFPCIFYNPKNNTLTVSSTDYQQSFKGSDFDAALASYLSLLKQKGYEIDGEAVDNNTYVEVNGEKMVYVKMEELFPSTEEVESHFTTDQYDFLYSNVGALTGYSYLSGYGNSPRDYIIMMGAGYKKTARLRIVGKDIAHEFTFDQLGEAFDQYRACVKQRIDQQFLL